MKYQISLDESVDDLTKALMSDFLPNKGTKEELNLIDVFHLNLKMEESHECNDEECKFFMSFYNK